MNLWTGNAGRLLIVAGVIFIITGLVFVIVEKFGIRGFRLPGDIAIHKNGFNFYFPIVTCLLLSIGFSLLLWIFSLFKR